MEIVNNYARKLPNSGYKGEQIHRFITNSIKGNEKKLRMCREQGRRLHRSSLDSQGARMKRKLLAKTNSAKSERGGRTVTRSLRNWLMGANPLWGARTRKRWSRGQYYLWSSHRMESLQRD